MSFLYRHETSIERQVFLLARAWQKKGLVDCPTRPQVARFVVSAVTDGAAGVDAKVVDLLHESLQERSYIDSVGMMEDLDRDGNGVERQAFLLACVWDDRDLADGPTLPQVSMFMHMAEAEGQWTPEQTKEEGNEYNEIAARLHESLQLKRPRSQPSTTTRCKAVDYVDTELQQDVRCVGPVMGERSAPLGIHFCVSHISCWHRTGIAAQE
jgi:hypothetical protein